jgi:hypothetical protein
MPVSLLNVECVGDKLLLNVDSVGLGKADQGPPRRRMMRDSSEARHSRFCVADGVLVRICWRRDCRWDWGRDDAGRERLGRKEVGRDGGGESRTAERGIVGSTGEAFSTSIEMMDLLDLASSMVVLVLDSLAEVGRESCISMVVGAGRE